MLLSVSYVISKYQYDSYWLYMYYIRQWIKLIYKAAILQPRLHTLLSEYH